MSVAPTHVKGLFLTTTGVLIMSPDGLLVRLIQTDPWTLLFWRCFLTAVAILLFFVLVQRKKTFAFFYGVGKVGLIVSFFSGLNTLLFVVSVRWTNVANTLVLISTTPIFAFILGHFFLKEKTSLKTGLTILATFLGVLAVFGGSLKKGNLAGDLCALTTAFFMAVNIAIIRANHTINMTPCISLGGFLVAFILFFFVEPLSISVSDAGYLILLAFLIIPISSSMITLGTRYLRAAETSLLLLLETILGPIWVWVVLKESPDFNTLIGGGIILLALILHSVSSLREPEPEK